ncbi:hypothetical protein [Weissella tructae]
MIGDYDCVDELDVIEYVESLPDTHEPILDLKGFKTLSAQYFTPSDLIDGLARKKANIANIQGITFDLDSVPIWDELKSEFYTLLINSQVEAYLWKTPSSFAVESDHENGARLFLPLGEPINPNHLDEAVREVVINLARGGLNVLDYGADITASKTVGRLMGLPLQKKDTIVPWDMENRKRYKIQTPYTPKVSKENYAGGFGGFNEEPTVENLTSFIERYTQKHGITFVVGERDNSLTRVFGALKKAFDGIDDTDLLSAFDNAGISNTLDNPEKDILSKAKRLLR